MNRPLTSQLRSWNRHRLTPVAVVFLLVAPVLSPAAESIYRPAPTPGGLDPRPRITSVTVTQQTATVTFEGLQPPFKVQQAAALENAEWRDVNHAGPAGSVEVAVEGALGLFRVEGPEPNFVGSANCITCHADQHASWSETTHAHALEPLKESGQATNPDCLQCHTVGHGFSNGFQSESLTPTLAHVQCENCHGPAGNNHWDDPSLKPKTTIAAETCGGCHNTHHPTYTEWLDSTHGRVDPELHEEFADVASGPARMRACGACHSGAVRMAFLKGWKTGQPAVLPTGDDAADFAITCSVCHNSHDATYAAQLRNPTASDHYYSYSTASSTDFAAQYDPDLQICGQCHNQRGANWTGTSRPPHHSPQYNLLIGQIFEPGTALAAWNGVPHGHGLGPNQCVKCHVQPRADAYPQHSFQASPAACVDCHDWLADESIATIALEGIQDRVKDRIASVQAALNNWGLHHSPEPIRATYGALAWEFTNAGQLSNPSGDAALRGPTSAEQALIPDSIKQARFLVYMVEHDGSYGAHNRSYAEDLLEMASLLVLQTP